MSARAMVGAGTQEGGAMPIGTKKMGSYKPLGLEYLTRATRFGATTAVAAASGVRSGTTMKTMENRLSSFPRVSSDGVESVVVQVMAVVVVAGVGVGVGVGLGRRMAVNVAAVA
jgi:hypothetical protein